MLHAMPPVRGIAGLRSAHAGWRARRLLRSGAVVIDTETTDFGGETIEIAVVDAVIETVLLNTLVRPTGPIAADATAVHGITDRMCAEAPSWSAIWPHVQAVLAGRPICAWNAPFDRGQVGADCLRHGLRPPRLRWVCLMRLDAIHRGRRRWRKLGGGHRAAMDAIAAARVLHQIGNRP